MSQLIDRRATAIGAAFERTQAIFDLSTENPNILEALALSTPGLLNDFESVQRRIPLPRTATVDAESHFYRLPSHNRSFCYSLGDSDAIFDAPAMVFKGSEPLLPDFSVLIAWMLQAPLRKSTRVMADHFPLAEGKIPGALSRSEALREANIALDIQKKHLKHYGAIARIPTPLLIHSISDQKRDACRNLLRRELSQPAFDRIEPLLNCGLAIYVYYYPSAPIRSDYWGGGISPQMTQYIKRTFSAEVTVRRWIQLLVRLLYLGYLPYSVRNDGLGACMDFGNATLDGGFCDPDSIVPISSCADDEFFREGVIQSVAQLQKTVARLLGLADPSHLYPSIDEFACRQYIHHILTLTTMSEGRPGLQLDDRLMQLISPRSLEDVRLATTRRKRIAWYTHFAQQVSGPDLYP